MNWFSNAGSLAELHEQCGEYNYDLKRRVLPPEFPTEAELLFGEWDEDSYEGGFYLLWRRDGELFEMQMSHCSCNSYSDDSGHWARNAALTPEYIAKLGRRHGEGEPQAAWNAVVEALNSEAK